jgi:hypothetical protein
LVHSFFSTRAPDHRHRHHRRVRGEGSSRCKRGKGGVEDGVEDEDEEALRWGRRR